MTQAYVKSQLINAIESVGSPHLAKAVESGRITGQAALYAMLDSYRLIEEEYRLVGKLLELAKLWKI